ncbi:hypothetical protein GGD66_006167 [Bradyrhizobium sp. CIR48]|uniref:DUF3100 domain-containing protein n=1 Tax=Bradyrhizobium sp. CIR48 TaxID=2663840 RepID=UPI00179D389A|nr:DUF3100 domain-containing protein [Bradyrhizobium sp. CIR48]MBB4427584.1 hypothetical protein [Bradyrhizobium sp. CIR48]
MSVTTQEQADTMLSSTPSALRAWRVHVWVLVITLIAEMIGNVSVPLGIGTVVLLPLVWAMILGAAVSIASARLPSPIGLSLGEQKAASTIIQAAVLIFVAKLALLVGGAIPELVKSGLALVFQEVGHFLGTALLGLPIALLLGIKREAVGATFSVGREPSLAIISERYGMNSPEGRGVMAEYITGTVIGAIFIALVASFLTSLHIFNPLALAMGAGVGSGSMMAAASGAIAAQQTPELSKQVAAFAAASNLITTTVGTYFTLFLSLPFSNFMYRLLEPRLGRLARARTKPASDVEVKEHDQSVLPLLGLVGLLAIVAIYALIFGNWITYHVPPTNAVLGAVIIAAVAAAGEILKRVLPFRVPAVFWATLIGMALTAPYWPGSAWFAATTGKMNFLALSTPVLTYAGLSLGKDLAAFRALGWRIVVTSLAANAGTFIFATLIAEALMRSGS